MIKSLLLCAGIGFAFVSFNGAAQAKGCIKGAIVGGVAGHYAGHHGKTGAAVGCVVGHHEATKHQREQSETNTPNR